MPPKLTHSENGPEDEDTSLLLEAQYRIPLSDHIMITPGFFVVFNPDHDSEFKSGSKTSLSGLTILAVSAIK